MIPPTENPEIKTEGISSSLPKGRSKTIQENHLSIQWPKNKLKSIWYNGTCHKTNPMHVVFILIENKKR